MRNLHVFPVTSALRHMVIATCVVSLDNKGIYSQVFRLFRPVHPVVAVSARTGWELDTLVSALMTALPDHAASPLMTRLQDELRTESVRSQAREQFTGAVDRIFDTAESVCIASVARTVLRAVRDSVVSVARAVWNWIFF